MLAEQEPPAGAGDVQGEKASSRVGSVAELPGSGGRGASLQNKASNAGVEADGPGDSKATLRHVKKIQDVI